MQKELVEQWASLSKKALESMKELGEINTKIIGKMTEQQQAILDTCLEASSKEMELAGAGKDPKEVLSSQTELATEYNKKFAEIVRNTSEVFVECKDDLTTWAEKNTETAMSSMNK